MEIGRLDRGNPATADTPFGDQFGFRAHVYQTISGLEPGATYTVSGWAIVDSYGVDQFGNPLQTVFGLSAFDDADFHGTIDWSAPTQPTALAQGSLDSNTNGNVPTWREVSFTFTAPTSGSIDLVVRKQSFGGAVVCNWDNIWVTRTGAGVDTDQSPNTFTFNVTPAADAPEGADRTIDVPEDGSHTFTAADFGFSDPIDNPADAFQEVIIDTLPATGTLRLSGADVTVGQVIAVADISNLVWTAPANQFGNGIANFDFRVVDTGTVANEVLGPNLVTNSSFENVPVAANTPIPGYSAATPPTLAEVTPPELGGWSLVIETNGGGWYLNYGTTLRPDTESFGVDTPFDEQALGGFNGRTQIYQTISGLEPGATYTVSGSAVEMNATFNLSVYDDADFNGIVDTTAAFQPTPLGAVAGTHTNSTGVTEWNTYTFTFTAPASGTVDLVVNSIGLGTSVSGADNISLQKVTPVLANTDPIANTITFNVTDVNDPPVATPSTSSGDEDTAIVVDLTGTDVDGTIAAVTVTSLPPVGEGVLYLADGTTPVVAGTPLTPAEAASLVFVPATNFNGDVTLAFTVTDDDGTTSAPANEVITVNDVNDPPVATPSTSSGNEDTNIPVDLTGTDVDGTVDFVTVTALPPATEGVLYLPDGVTPVTANTPISAADAANLVFVPATNFNGPVTIAFTVTDNDGTTSAPANEVITVNDVNDPPVATPSTSSGDEDTNIPVDLVGTDVDGTVDFVTVTTLPPAAQGVLYLPDGVTPVTANTPISAADAANLVFVPATNFNGPVTIAFTVTDNDGTTSAPANEVITVNDVNDPPVATPSTSSGDEDTNIPVDLTGTDVDGTVDFVTVTTLPPAAQGVLYLPDGVTPVTANTPISAADAANLVFVPATNFNGTVTIPFTVTDDDGTTSAPANEVITVNDVNDPPVATPSTSSGNEDTNIPVDLTGTDVDGTVDFVTVTSLPPATEGVLYLADGVTPVTVNTPISATDAGNLVFIPATNFNGTVTIPFTVTDNDGTTSAPANEVITVNDVNDPPVATPSTSSGDEDTNIPVDLTGTDVDGTVDFVTATALPPATEGVLYMPDGTTPVTANTPISAADAGNLVFIPATNFNGTVTIPFTVTDNDGTTSAPANEVITVNDVNDPPVATPSTSSGDEDTNIPVDLVGTDVDGTVDFVTVTTLPPAAQGVLYMPDGTTPVTANTPISAADAANLVFVPATNFNGTVTIPFTVTDDDGTTSAPANEVITVNDVNDPPVATPSTSSGNEDTNIPVDLTGTDVDGTVDFVTVTALPPATEGVLYLPDGVTPVTANTPISAADAANLVFVPATNFNGPVTIAFTVTDNDGTTSAPANEVITVNAVNDAIVDGNEARTVYRGFPLSVPAATGLLANATDPDGDIPQVTSFTFGGQTRTVTPSTPGSVTINWVGTLLVRSDGSFVFTPATFVWGAIPVATYTVADGRGSTDTSTLTLTMATNRGPVDGNETRTVVEDTPISVPASTGLLANATDANGDPLQITRFVVNGTTYPVSPATPGTAVIAGVGTLTIGSDGGYSFTPAPNYAGPVPVVTYTVSDGYQTDTSTLTLTMQAVNDGVTDGDEVRTVVEDTPLNVPAASGLLANAVDPDGHPIRITSFTVNGTTFVVTPSAAGVANIAGIGTLQIQSNGAYRFTPVANYAGPVPVVTYTVTDSLGATDTSTLTLTMQAVNDRPTAVADSTSTPENTPVVVNLTANDIDPDGDPLTVVSATVPAAQGTMSNVGGVWTFTPTAGFNGEARITYTIEDAQGERSTSTHSVFVGSPPLVAQPGSHTGLFNSTMSSSVAGNDTFSPGSTFSLVTPPPSGSLVLGPDGRFRFTPTRGFSGTVSFTYQISDQYGQTVTAVETIRVLTFIESCFVTFR